jgi:hypothetical protein
MTSCSESLIGSSYRIASPISPEKNRSPLTKRNSVEKKRVLEQPFWMVYALAERILTPYRAIALGAWYMSDTFIPPRFCLRLLVYITFMRPHYIMCTQFYVYLLLSKSTIVLLYLGAYI